MNYFEHVFQEFWPQMKKRILYRTHVLQPLHKITSGSLRNLSFLEVCMHLNANFTCKNTIFERILSTSYGIFLKWTYRGHRAQLFQRKVFSKNWRNLQENIHNEIQHQIIVYNLANIPKDIRPKIAYENCAFDVLDVTCMSFAYLFHVCFPLG